MRHPTIASSKVKRIGNTKSVHFLRLHDCSVEQPGNHRTRSKSACIIIYLSSTPNEWSLQRMLWSIQDHSRCSISDYLTSDHLIACIPSQAKFPVDKSTCEKSPPLARFVLLTVCRAKYTRFYSFQVLDLHPCPSKFVLRVLICSQLRIASFPVHP